MTKTRIDSTRITTTPPPPPAQLVRYATGLTSPVLALALAGCDKEFKLGDFVSDILAFDETKDYAIVGGVVAGAVIVGAVAGGGDSDSATSGGGASTPQSPSFSTDTATATATENATAVAYTPNATDPNSADTLTYSLKPNTGDVALFSITSAGALSFKTAPDYESPPSSKTSYSVTVIVSDGNSGTADAEQTVAITLNNVNEAPAFATDTATATAITENSGAGQLVYTPTAPTDPDTGDTIAYSLKDGGDKSAFTINTGTGAVTLTGDPNFETKPSYAFTIVATDADGLTDELAVTLAITNENEAPAFATDTATATAITENSGAGQLVYTPTAPTDPDTGDTIAYSLKDGGDKSAFTINTGTGAVTLTGDPNFETKPSYAFTIVATDAGGLTDELPVTLAITDVPNAEEVAVFTVRGSVNSNNKGVLTAEKLSDDPDGNGTFAYQWQRADTNSATDSDWTNITTNGTSASYTPVDGTDTGKFLRLKITYTDSASNSHTIYDQITKGGGASDSGVIKHRFFSLTNDSTSNADIFTTDAGNSGFTLWGGDGDDTLIGAHRTTNVFTWTIVGEGGNDLLIGGIRNDDLGGGAGNDIIEGRAGSDLIHGGAGADIMTGGTGSDRFTLELGETQATDRAKDVVTDFTSGDDIRVDVTGNGNAITVDTLAKLRDDVDIRWTNNTKETTGTTTNDSSTNDTVIYYTNGTASTSDDEIVMVLEDYTTTLTFADFSLF